MRREKYDTTACLQGIPSDGTLSGFLAAHSTRGSTLSMPCRWMSTATTSYSRSISIGCSVMVMSCEMLHATSPSDQPYLVVDMRHLARGIVKNHPIINLEITAVLHRRVQKALLARELYRIRQNL